MGAISRFWGLTHWLCTLWAGNKRPWCERQLQLLLLCPPLRPCAQFQSSFADLGTPLSALPPPRAGGCLVAVDRFRPLLWLPGR